MKKLKLKKINLKKIKSTFLKSPLKVILLATILIAVLGGATYVYAKNQAKLAEIMLLREDGGDGYIYTQTQRSEQNGQTARRSRSDTNTPVFSPRPSASPKPFLEDGQSCGTVEACELQCKSGEYTLAPVSPDSDQVKIICGKDAGGWNNQGTTGAVCHYPEFCSNACKYKIYHPETVNGQTVYKCGYAPNTHKYCGSAAECGTLCYGGVFVHITRNGNDAWQCTR